MPNGRPIGIIQQPGFFESLLARMGVNRPQQPFTLDGNVVPVVLVDSGVSFVAAPTPPYRVTDIFTEGLLTNPAAGALLADTGPLPVGPYSLQLILEAGVNNTYTFEWRNAANSADLWTQVLRFDPAVGSLWEMNFRLEVANAGERFRILITALVAGTYQGSILARV